MKTTFHIYFKVFENLASPGANKSIFSKVKNKVLKEYEHIFILPLYCSLYKENRIYIRGEFTRKKCKTAFFVVFPYCRYTSHIYAI